MNDHIFSDLTDLKQAEQKFQAEEDIELYKVEKS